MAERDVWSFLEDLLRHGGTDLDPVPGRLIRIGSERAKAKKDARQICRESGLAEWRNHGGWRLTAAGLAHLQRTDPRRKETV